MFENIKFWLEQRLCWIVQYGRVTRASSNGDDSQGGPASVVQVAARRMWNWGVRSVPPVGSESISLGVAGSSGNRVMIAAETTKRTASGIEYTYGPTDLKEGETALYDAAGSVLRMSQDGTTRVDTGAPGGTKADLILQGGTASVTREGDGGDGGALSVVTATVAGVPVVTQVLYWEPGSLVATVIAAFPARTSMSLKLGPGAPNVKA